MMRISILLFLALLTACAHTPKKRLAKGETADPYYYLVRSNLKAFEGDLPASLADLEKALAVHPDNVFLKYLAAERRARVNELDRAQVLIEAIVGWTGPHQNNNS